MSQVVDEQVREEIEAEGLNYFAISHRATRAWKFVRVLMPVLETAVSERWQIPTLAQQLDNEAWRLAGVKAGVAVGPEGVSAETRSTVIEAIRQEVSVQRTRNPFTEATASPASSLGEGGAALPDVTTASDASTATSDAGPPRPPSTRSNPAVAPASGAGVDGDAGISSGTQSSIFGAPAATEARDAAIDQAEAHADPDFLEVAYQALLQVASRKATFIVDEVWNALAEMAPDLVEVSEPRAMGAVMRRGVKENVIAATAQFAPSDRKTAHRNHRTVWESLIVEQAVGQ